MPRRPGAAADLNKSANSAQLIDVIRRVAQGKLFITLSVAELMAEQLVLWSNFVSILEKTGARNDVEVALYPVREGV